MACPETLCEVEYPVEGARAGKVDPFPAFPAEDADEAAPDELPSIQKDSNSRV